MAPAESSPLLTTPQSAPPYLCFTTRRAAMAFTLGIIFLSMSVKEGTNMTQAAAMPALRRLNYTEVIEYLPGTATASYSLGKFSQIYMTFNLNFSPNILYR